MCGTGRRTGPRYSRRAGAGQKFIGRGRRDEYGRGRRPLERFQRLGLYAHVAHALGLERLQMLNRSLQQYLILVGHGRILSVPRPRTRQSYPPPIHTLFTARQSVIP